MTKRPKKAQIVKCRDISPISRVHCAMHASLDVKEPPWIMVPIDEEITGRVIEVAIKLDDGGYIFVDVDQTR